MSPLIVVVNNNDAARANFSFLADKEGWTVIGYNYAQVNIALIQQHKPDLIVLDFVEQPIGEGWGFLQALKMTEDTDTIPIIVCSLLITLSPQMTAYLLSRSVTVVPQPFHIEEVVSKVRQVISGLTALVLPSTKHLPILLVDDNVDISEEVLTILQLEGYLAVTVPNGRLALDAVRSGQHSLIFLDMQMPVMTGPEFIAAYALEPGPHTPVIIFSAQTDLPLETLPAFVVGRLRKPFMIKDMLKFVSQFALPI